MKGEKTPEKKETLIWLHDSSRHLHPHPSRRKRSGQTRSKRCGANWPHLCAVGDPRASTGISARVTQSDRTQKWLADGRRGGRSYALCDAVPADRARWESDHLRDEVRAYVREQLGEPEAVLVIDETGFLKKGTKSVGVQRQYSGTAGRIENCQLGVFLSYSSSKGHTLLDRELYLPKSWTQDQHAVGKRMCPPRWDLPPSRSWRHACCGAPGCRSAAAWVTGDTVYGSHRPLRAGLEARKQAYALAVTCQEHVEVAGKQQRVDQLAQQVAAQDWHRLSAGAGSKGPRLYDWVRLPLSSAVPTGWERWLVIRRSIPAGAEAAELAYVLVFARTGTTLQEMVTVIGSRWTVEQCFEVGKGEVGLDEYEVRSWQGWYRHITLCMLAQAFLTVLRPRAKARSQQASQEGKKREHHPLAQVSPSTLSEFKRKRGLPSP